MDEDPLLWNTKLPCQGVFFPLGFRLEIAANSKTVLEAASKSWGAFLGRFCEPAIRVRIGVVAGSRSEPIQPPVFRAQENLLSIISSPSDFAVCDLDKGFAFGWFSEGAIGDEAAFRFLFLDPVVYMLLENRYLTPVHASFVSLNGNGVMLCGDSGAGKSSFAYACARRGWTFLSDDASYVLRGRQDLVVTGNPYAFRFRESAKSLFPELRNEVAAPKPNGKMTIEIPTAGLPGIHTALEGAAQYVIFLNRQETDEPRLTPFSKEEAWLRLTGTINYGSPNSHEARQRLMARLLELEVLEFRYSDFDAAISLLEAHIRRGC